MADYGLDNIILILEQHKNCKKMEISQKGIIELLCLLKELKGKEEANKILQETFNALQELREELIAVVRTDPIEEVIDYINNYNSLVYAYTPTQPLLEFLEKFKNEGEKK